MLRENPFVKYHNRQRGLVRCAVTGKVWKADYRIVPEVLKPGGPVETGVSIAVEAGRPGARRA